jgi:alkaline phosphatase
LILWDGWFLSVDFNPAGSGDWNPPRAPELRGKRKFGNIFVGRVGLSFWKSMVSYRPMKSSTQTMARRDWLKTTALGAAFSGLASGCKQAPTTGASAAKPRGVIFMVSDGMSPGVLTLAQAHSEFTRKRGTAWWGLLDNPAASRGLMDNASANSLVTDSAAASSAWGGGQRVKNGAINMDANGKSIDPIAKILKERKGANIGLVTTATVTHATPAGFAASIGTRGEEAGIAPQYLDRVDVILGGGAGFFSPINRPDKRDLRGEFKSSGYQIVRDRASLLAAESKRLLGTFTSGHLPMSLDRGHVAGLADTIPTLAEMATAALSRFLGDDKPFLLQIEGARIDHAAHLNDIAGLLEDQIAFDEAVAKVLEMTAGRRDILVVVTSDHGNANPGLNGTGVSYGESTSRFQRVAGMKASHERIFSEWHGLKDDRNAESLIGMIREYRGFDLAPDEAEALLLSLQKKPIVEWSHQLEKPEGLLGQFEGNHTGIGWTGTSHTSDPTLVSAIGPQAERFSGMVRNTDVFTHLVEMLG